MNEIILTAPDDWHIHLRDGDLLKYTVNDAQKSFARVLAMPNLIPPVTTIEQAKKYHQNILQHVTNQNFKAFVTLYLTDNTKIADIREIKHNPEILAIKLYPSGSTTNSEFGVTKLENVYKIFEVLQEEGVPLLVHGEVADETDIFDREAKFIDLHLTQIVKNFPNLKIVLEHITTKEATQFILEAKENVAATITPQHLRYNRNHLLAGGIKPHFYCLPILKRAEHRDALIKAATSGNKKFFLGTDSAPHLKHKKENACGCAGCYSAPFAISLYADVFANVNALDKLNNFAAVFGANFYGLPENTQKIRLTYKENFITNEFDFGKDAIVPLGAGEKCNFTVEAIND